ncbi:MAG TPA: peptidoglycan-binding domain-containing protein [Candidatus Saccharimonadales bacterium]|nr:peptidoglycan-binding domain-containing protein [Candidatus Saccharimonadales bacterium]
MKKLNMRGFSQHLVLAVVVVGFGVVGAYLFVRSHAATCTSYTYAQGVNGTCVANIQKMLNGLTYERQPNSDLGSNQLAVDGSFGPLTKSKIVGFQKFSVDHLVVDGKVGPKTWNSLCLYVTQLDFSRTTVPVMRNAYLAAKNSGCTMAH